MDLASIEKRIVVHTVLAHKSTNEHDRSEQRHSPSQTFMPERIVLTVLCKMSFTSLLEVEVSRSKHKSDLIKRHQLMLSEISKVRVNVCTPNQTIKSLICNS